MANKNNYIIRLGVENGGQVTAELERVGKDGKKSLMELGNAGELVNKSFVNLGRVILTRLAPLLGGAALLRSVKSVTSEMAELERQARRTGMAASELQELQYAAMKVKGSTEGMTEAMSEFNKRLGEAQATGQGELSEILKQYSIQLKNQDGTLRTSREIMHDYAEAIKNAASEAERLHLADKAFGNTELVEVFSRGKDGLREFAEEARRSGVIIDDHLIKRGAQISKMIDDIWFNSKQWSKGSLLLVLDESIKFFQDLKQEVVDTTRLVDAFWSSFFRGGQDRSILSPEDREAMKGGIDDLLSNMPTDFDGLMGTDAGVVKGGYDSGGNRPTVRSKDEIAQAEAAQKKMQAVIDMLVFRNEQMQRSNEEQDLYNQLRAAGVELDSAAGREIEKLVKEYKDLEDQQRKTKEATESLQKATDGFFERLIDGFEDGKISADEFGQAALQVIKEIFLAKDSATGDSLLPNIFGSVSTGFGDFFSGIFGFANGGIMTSGGPLPLRQYANGGIANSPQVAVYGEGSKPEAYVPLPDGRSIPVTMKGGGYGGMVVNVYENTGKAKVSARQSTSGGGVDILIDEIDGAIRGGRFDRSMSNRFGINPSLG